MKKFNLRSIMLKAWELFRKAAAGVTEEINTWVGWRLHGYEVIHGSKALFGVDLIWGSKGDSAIYKARFFGRSQVQEAAMA